MDFTREKLVLIVAETQAKARYKTDDFDTLDPEIRAQEMFLAEQTIDALQKHNLVILAHDE